MKFKFATILLFFVFLSHSALFANDRNASNLKIREAIPLMDSGKYDEAEELLKEAVELDDDNYNAVYELGYLFLLKKDLDTAEEYLEDLVEMDDITAQCWQMLGNVYDMNQKHEKALETYHEGLEQFPESGALYYELGVVSKDSLELAVNYFEKGVEVQPEYPTNYFSLANFFLTTEQEVWGMMYGEIFINLTLGSKKANNIGLQLYNTYQSEITRHDSTVSVSFFSSSNLEDAIKGAMINKFFPSAYEMTLSLASVFNLEDGDLDLPKLIKIRTDFITNYYKNEFNKSFTNVLFEWHKKLIDEGYFEVYNYLIFVDGDPLVAQKWIGENQAKVQEFINWLQSNRFPISKENAFLRKNNI